ncbi:hypothetical protein ACJRPK_05850 [Aquimarina sp. 2-A2]|uniref:hypothetical protein n=1 Tax=Aquimarina sp. 2-A2 TaxID=3382644 RepID=UPI00387EEEEA
MKKYKTRKINFIELINVNDWKIKIYTISQNGDFRQDAFYQNVIEKLPKWLAIDNGFDSSNDKIGFLILHRGKEGIFSVINWWVGKNMLNTNVYLTESTKPDRFKKISGNGIVACVWELEIINHERTSWLNNILKKEPIPSFEIYLEDVINTEI